MDLIDGFVCDYGFQVLFIVYCEVQYYLSYSQLGLSIFWFGVVVYKNVQVINLVDFLWELL